MGATTIDGRGTTRTLEAFGETKTLEAWALDPRAAAWAEEIARRLDVGMGPEQAVASPSAAPVSLRAEVTAWGERKALSVWGKDPRAAVPAATIQGRLGAGWGAERAIGTPSARTEWAPVEAFGLRMTVAEWARDPRTRVSEKTLRGRLESGWEAEAAVATPPVKVAKEGVGRTRGRRTNPISGRRAELVSAWGEAKTLREWADDPRAGANGPAIRSRLKLGWAAEEAIGAASQGGGRRMVEAWGETKCLADWARDARAGTNPNAMITRLNMGWPAERAIAEPAREARQGGITAFGETKAAPEWAADPRCSVTDTCINVRLQRGMSPEEAIAAPNAKGWRVAEAKAARPGDAPAGKPGHTRFVRGWDEVRSLNEWVHDARCAVSLGLLQKRLGLGWEAEAAISTPSKTTLRGGIEAFGERKLLKDWADDARCPVVLATLAKRLRAGWDAERAILTPNGFEAPAAGERAGAGTKFPLAVMLTAWDETKNVTEWARDPRCPVGANAIRSRLQAGWAPEAAISTPDRTTDLMVTAFGETKRAAHWAKDPRCAVTETCLRGRVKKGWDAEAALTTPTDAGLVAAFGERKSRYEWIEDPRCVVSYGTFVDRMAEGMPAEEAMTTPPQVAPAVVSAWGETKRLSEWAADPRCLVAHSCVAQRLAKGMAPEAALTRPSHQAGRERRWEAFGESRTLPEWAQDARCAVPFAMLRQRVHETGWDVERAMTTPVGEFVRGRFREVRDAFGESKRVFDWAEDPRCAVARETLASRLREGWPFEEALTTPSGRRPSEGTPTRLVAAFGETKGLAEWARDPRCRVREETLGSRLRGGWSAERAISEPPRPHDFAKGVPRGGGRREGTTAFGETKGLARWAEDPRCRVPRNVLEARLKAGWPAEDALTVVIGAPYDLLARAA